jgi:CubicO group peptidase (beta-lactamase class C family)
VAEERGGTTVEADPRPDDDPGPPRVSFRRRVVAWGMLVCFALALAFPFAVSPRLRSVFRAVPAMRSPDVAVQPSQVVPPDRLAAAQQVVNAEVARGGFPGGALAVGVRGATLLEVGVGRTRWGRLARPVDADETLYDLASLTKAVATTTAVMLLVDDGKMRLDDPISRWLPHFTGRGREKVTVRQVLTHTAGLPAAMPVRDFGSDGDRLYRVVNSVDLISEPGEDVLYSDVGFVLLGLAASNAAGQPLPAFLRKRVWEPLGMAHTRFEPGIGCDVCAPTLTLEDGTPFAGKTNDPFSRDLGGITGNAGLFSTAHDLGRFAAMLANGGELGGVRIVKEATLRQFRQPQPGAGTRGLGFEVFCREGTVPDAKGCETPYAYGHTGYTGTSMWIDPERGIWVVLLANRTYLPKAPNRIRAVRRKLFDLVTGIVPPPPSAPEDTTPETR